MVFTKQLRQKKGCQFKMKLSRWLPSVTRISFFRLGMSCLSWLSESSFQNFVCLWNFLDALNYVPLQFPKLCGMTGTAATESTEFESIYKLKVTIVPTNKPMIRKVSSFLSLLCNTLIFFCQMGFIPIPEQEECVCVRARNLCINYYIFKIVQMDYFHLKLSSEALMFILVDLVCT